MPRTYEKKNVRCTYSSESMNKAIEAVRRGVPLAAAAEEFKVPKSTLGKHYKNPALCFGGGRKPELSEENEKSLAEYLKVCALHGQGLTKKETVNLVHEFVNKEGLRTRWNDNVPGDDWFNGFLKRHPDLRIRTGEPLSSQRVRGADPFTVYKFYQDLENLYREENIGPNSGRFIFNCDETSFSHDPKNVKVIAPKGVKRISKQVAGSGKTNTTVLACGAADGTKMPPFIIFAGKFIWSSWIPNDDYPGTTYTAQKKGWMEGSLFAHWFSQVFLKCIESKESRNGQKVILIFDGVIFHINYDMVKNAHENDVILIKLPPNLSHFLQPLDKAVFKTVKMDWNTLMIQWNRENPGVLLPKEQFSRYMKVIWEDSLKSKNLRSGFQSTGLFPLNCERFPEDAFDPIKLARYKEHKLKSCPSTVTVQSNTVSKTSSAVQLGLMDNRSTRPMPSPSAAVQLMSKPSTSSASGAIDNVSSVPSTSSVDTISPFEKFIRVKLTENVRRKQTMEMQPCKKRKKMSENVGEILTSPEVQKRLKKAEKEKAKRQPAKDLKQQRSKRKNTVPKKVLDHNDVTSSSDSSESLSVDLNDEPEYSSEAPEGDEIPPTTSAEKRVELLLEQYYAIYYDIAWYIGRLIDFDDVETSKIKFLKQELELFTWPKHEDVQVVENKFIFYGPINIEGYGPFTLKRIDKVKIKEMYSRRKMKMRMACTKM